MNHELVYEGKKSGLIIDNMIEDIKNKYSIDDHLCFLVNDDNFKAMSVLLNKYENGIDLVYIDPPFNTNAYYYHDKVKTSHISNSRESVVAYKDKFKFNEYLEYIRERLILIHKLLSEKGTLYFHIDINIGHYIKIILDEIFGIDNLVNDITRIKSNPKNFSRKAFGNEKDVIYVYSKRAGKNIFRNIKEKYTEEELLSRFPKVDEFGRRYTTIPCHAPGETKNGITGTKWKNIDPPRGRHWRCSPQELDKLDQQGLIEWSKTNVPRIKKFADDHSGKKIQDVWKKFKDPQYPLYPTEKNMDMLEMMVKQSSEQDSLIMDCFCGSGSFLVAGIRHGRRVIGIDNSRTAINIAGTRPELQNIPVVQLIDKVPGLNLI